ncbi:hypothetical protein QCA50_002797 [Cerrena zonata]|uniref:Uncharacterized protein n=1 Tax=Cerrena zonata TaxID=2478898 RepID=A0AAW0GIR9_9APHY
MEPMFRVMIFRFGVNFSVASLSSLPLAGVSIWFRGELDVFCQSIPPPFWLLFPPDFDLCNHYLGIHFILFSVSSATAVLFFGLRPPGTIVAFLSRLAIFQFIVGVELANSYVFPYVLGETDEAVVSPNAIGVVLLAFVALVQSIALVVLLQWSAQIFTTSAPDELPACTNTKPGLSLYTSVPQSDENSSDDKKVSSAADDKSEIIAFPAGYSPTFNPEEGFKFIYGPRLSQWLDEDISPLEVPTASSPLDSSETNVPTPAVPQLSAEQKCHCVHCSDLPCSQTSKIVTGTPADSG